MTLLPLDLLLPALIVICVTVFAQHRLVPPKRLLRWTRRNRFLHWRGDLGYALLAILAVALFPGFSQLPLQPVDIVIYIIAVWVALSISWSDIRRHSLRRFAILGISALLALSIASSHPLGQRVAFVAACSVALACISFLVSISRRHFLNPKSGRYGGIALPNQQACICTFVVLSTVCLVELGKVALVPGTLVVSVALLLLFLTNTTTEIASGFAAVLSWIGVSLIQSGSVSWFVAVIPLGYISAHLIVNGMPRFRRRAAHVSWAFENHPVMAHVNLGKDPRSIGTLTGRVPLWKNLIPFSRERWLLGFGHDGFWNPERSYAVAKWQPVNSHSIYFDALIGWGSVGLLLMLSVFAVAATVSWGLPPPLGQFALALIVFVSLTGLCDSIFLLGGFETFVLLLVVFNLGSL